MHTLNIQEIDVVSGAGLENCNIPDMSKEVISGAITGGFAGMGTASVAIPGLGAVPGWLAGALGGGSLAGLIYGAKCWW